MTTEESAKQILSLLPGVDCGGGCGFPTCQACSEAIADGCSPALCPAITSDTAARIAEILDVDAVEAEDKVAFVRCAGTAAASDRFSSCGSCDEAKDKVKTEGTAKGECKYGCLGLGTCIEKCKFNAMRLEEGHLVIDRDKCTGCEACVGGCAQHIIEMIPREATNFIPCSSKADEEETLSTCNYGCIGCGDCAAACPKGAIEMVTGRDIKGRYAKINYSMCEGCITCTVKCRKKIIIDSLHDLAQAKEEVALVQCVGGSRGRRKLTEMGLSSCGDAASIDLDGNDICEYSCLGLGDCVKACRYSAISTETGVAKVDPDRCVGCGDCMRACPRNKIMLVPYKGVKQIACSSKADPQRRMEVCTAGCIACGDCVDNCPMSAITMTDGIPFIDHSKCVNCGICRYVCSRDLIQERFVPEYNYLQAEAAKIDEDTDERR